MNFRCLVFSLSGPCESTQTHSSVLSVILSELMMTSAISCPLWSSVYECHRVEYAFTSPVRT